MPGKIVASCGFDNPQGVNGYCPFMSGVTHGPTPIPFFVTDSIVNVYGK